VKALRKDRVQVIGVALVCAAMLAACSSSKGADGGGGTPADQPSPGVTADAINVGYMFVDIGTLSRDLGFKVIEDGGPTVTNKGIQAVVDYVNANGGAGGRKVNAIIKPYTASLDSPEYAEAQCRSFTQDSQVFAMVMDGQFQNNSRPCYAAGRAIMLDQTLIAHDQAEFLANSPYLWTPNLPTLDTFLTAQLDVLKNAGWFNGAKGVAVAAPDTEVTRRLSQSIVEPYLKNLGITNSSEYYIDSSNAGTLGATSSAALTAATSKGQDRVFVFGGARVESVMLSTSEAENLNANYTISTYDSPAFLVDNPATIVTARRAGMAGLGFQPGSDMRVNSSDEAFPNPARPTEVLCKQIVDAAGAVPTVKNRENYRVLMQFCDSTLMLKAALDKAPKDLTPNAFRDAVWSLGNTWQSATTYGSSWQKDQYAGATVGRGMYWDDACVLSDRPSKGCFRFGTGDIPLPPPTQAIAVASAPAASVPAASVPAATQPVATP